MIKFSKKLNSKLKEILEAFPSQVAAAEALGVPTGSLGGWINKKQAGRLAAARLEVACDRVLEGLHKEPEVEEPFRGETPVVEVPTTSLPNVIVMNRLDVIEAKLDALLRVCGIDPKGVHPQPELFSEWVKRPENADPHEYNRRRARQQGLQG